MDEHVAKLIEALATKLGTTAEYLWGVLVKQATIQAAAEATLLICSVAATVWLIYLFKKNSKEWEEDTMTFVAVLAIFMTLLSVIMFFFLAPTIITAIFNPEYWALKQVLK